MIQTQKQNTQNEMYNDLPSPTGIAGDRYGNIYVACFSDNMIYKITPDGKRQVFLKNPLISGPISLASDSVGNIYVSNYSANNVLKITPQGTVTVLVERLDKPYGLHVEGNMLFITCQGSNSIFIHHTTTLGTIPNKITYTQKEIPIHSVASKTFVSNIFTNIVLFKTK